MISALIHAPFKIAGTSEQVADAMGWLMGWLIERAGIVTGGNMLVDAGVHIGQAPVRSRE